MSNYLKRGNLGQQQHLRAFASAFGHQRPLLDPRGCPISTLPSADWRLAAKAQAEQWAFHAAAVAAADLPRRLSVGPTPAGTG